MELEGARLLRCCEDWEAPGRERLTTIPCAVSGPDMAKRHKARKLPVQQLTVLALCRFAEPIAFSSVYVHKIP